MKQILLMLLSCIVITLPPNVIAKQGKTKSSKTINQNQTNKDSLNEDSLRDEINSNFEEIKNLINDNRIETLQQEFRKQYEKLDQKIQTLEKQLTLSQQAQDKSISKESPDNLGEWWWRNSLTFDPMPEELLYHFDLTYSWARMKGNAIADDHNLQVRFVFRKNRFTNYFRYNLNKINRALGDDGTAVVNLMTGQTDEFVSVNKNVQDTINHHTFYESRFDLLKNLYVSFGGIYDEDDLISIDQRIVGFIGFGGIPIQKKNFSLDFYFAIGKEKKEYTKQYHDYANLLKPYPNLYYLLPNYKSGPIRSDVSYFQEKCNWAINQYISLEENFHYIRDFRNADKYRWGFNGTILFQLNTNIAISIMYAESFDNTSNVLLGRKRDSYFSNGIQIAY